MEVKKGFYLGKDSSGFFVWNEKEIKRLFSKSFDEACIESRLITNNKNAKSWQVYEDSQKKKTNGGTTSTRKSEREAVKYQPNNELFLFP